MFHIMLYLTILQKQLNEHCLVLSNFATMIFFTVKKRASKIEKK
jgi:hypothetical protein